MKLFIVLTILIVACGCEGPQGPQGEAGTDCTCQSVSNSTTVTFDPSGDGSVTTNHGSTIYSTAGLLGPRITIFTGTGADYFNALSSGNHASLNAYVADPIDTDLCGLWYWTNDGTNWQLHTDNAVAYRSYHVPSAVTDDSGNAHMGMDKCMHDCQADSQCVGGFYNLVDGTTNTLVCVLVMDVGYEITTSSEFQAIDTQIPGMLMSNLQLVGAVDGGFFSICD